MDSAIEKIKEQILRELKRDPFADPASWLLVEKRLPKKLWSLLTDRSGAAQFTKKLPTIFDADSFIADTKAQRCWEIIGNFYKNQGRFHEAISIYFSLYVEVYDGDTIKAVGHDIEIKVRLVGIDAPETAKKKRKHGQPYSQEAKKYLSSLILNKTVDIKGHGLCRY